MKGWSRCWRLRLSLRRSAPRSPASSLAHDVDDAVIEEIRAALLEWKVLFFRDQHAVDRARHVAFGRRFGELEIHPITPAGQDQPEAFVIPAGGMFRAPDTWHSDVTWRPEPSLGSILRAVELPPVGGDTLWADMGKAYDLLDDETKASDRRHQGDARLRCHRSLFGYAQPPEVQAKMRAKPPDRRAPGRPDPPGDGTQDAVRERQLSPGGRSSAWTMPTASRSCAASTGRRRSPTSSAASAGGRARSCSGTTAATQHIVSTDFLPAKRVMERVTTRATSPSSNSSSTPGSVPPARRRRHACDANV